MGGFNHLTSFGHLNKNQLNSDFNTNKNARHCLFNRKFHFDYLILPSIKRKQDTLKYNFFKIETLYNNSNYQY